MKHPLLIGLASFGWRTGILFLALTAAGAMTFGTPDALKEALRESGAYKAAADQLAEKAGGAISEQFGVSADQKAIDQIAADNITAESLQKSAESNIDNTYGWLIGETEKPDIKLDLTQYVNGFLDGLGNQAVARATGLPECTPDQLKTIDPAKLDIMNLPCRPPGVDLNAAKDQAVSQAVSSNEFLSNPVISAESLPKDAEGKTAIDRVSYLPEVHTWSMRAPWIFGIMAVASALALYLIFGKDWRLTVRKLGRNFLWIGGVLAGIALLIRLALGYVTKPEGVVGSKLGSDEFGNVMLLFITSIEEALGNRVLMFGLAYLVVGGAMLALLRFLKAPPALETVPGAPVVSNANKTRKRS